MTSSANEQWQGYEDDGEPILSGGVTMLRARRGALHGSGHMWIWREGHGKRQVLLQKRASDSKTWPNHYDVSAAGHINFKESPLAAAVRETKEEIGIEINPQDAHLLFVHRQVLTYTPNKIIENEFQWVYGYDVTGTPHFKLEPSEVKQVLWVNIADLPKLIAGKVKGMRMVPHDKTYFDELTREIREYER